MKLKKLTIIFISIIAIAFALIAGLEWWNTNKSLISTDNAYVRASITTISSRVSSYVKEVPALTNSVVQKNDLLDLQRNEILTKDKLHLFSKLKSFKKLCAINTYI